MGYMSKDQFLQQQAERAANRDNGEKKGPFVGYFKLADDGDEAVVRFAYTDPAQFGIYTVHDGSADTKWKKINCLNDFSKGITNCPLCAAGVPLKQRFYIKMIEYVRGEDGSIIPMARVWDRPASYIQILTNLFTEYGDISKCVFKVKRSGAKGDMQTSYSIMFGNPSIYNEQLYPADFSAFDNYDIVGTQILDKSYQELAEMAGNVAEPASVGVNTNFATNVNVQTTPANVTYATGAPTGQPAGVSFDPTAPRRTVQY